MNKTILLNDIESIIDLKNENVLIYAYDDINTEPNKYNFVGSYGDMSSSDKVHYLYSTVTSITFGIVQGVDNSPTLNILIKES